MNLYDDVAGSILWTIPPSDEDVRIEFIRSYKSQLAELRDIDPSKHRGDINISIINLPIEDGTSAEVISEQIDRATVVIDGMIDAAERGKPGQGILIVLLKGDTLYGIIVSPDGGKTLSSSIPVEAILNAFEDGDRLQFILNIINDQAEMQNAVIAWDAIRALNDEITIPDIVE